MTMEVNVFDRFVIGSKGQRATPPATKKNSTRVVQKIFLGRLESQFLLQFSQNYEPQPFVLLEHH